MKIELQGLASIAGDKGAFYILIIFCRFLYYPFLEWLLGASPAKLLTETRILKNDGGRISLGTAFARTAGRHIPFEAFSYLGGEGAKGWHDACGYSIVVKEQRTGVKARMYLLILPVGLLLGAVTYFGLEWYNDYRSDVLKNSYHKYNGKNIENQLEHLSEGTIIFLSSEPLYYDWEPFAFKVTTIGTDSITGRMISLGTYGYDVTHKEIDEAFRLAEDTIPLTRLSRTVIYGNYVQQVKGRSYLPEGKIELKKKNYSIADVYQPSSPSLFYENPCKEGIISKVFHLQSTGANATLTSIELLEGKATWDITTPMMVSQETYYPMTIEPELNGEVYKIRLTLQDSLGRVYQYVVEGDEDGNGIYRTYSKE